MAGEGPGARQEGVPVVLLGGRGLGRGEEGVSRSCLSIGAFRAGWAAGSEPNGAAPPGL